MQFVWIMEPSRWGGNSYADKGKRDEWDIDDNRYNYEDFDAFQGMRVGIIKGGEVGESFKRYCAQNGVALTIIEYDETQELLDALGSGTLDGVAITHLGRSSVFRSVARFAPTPMYIAVSKQRPDLLA